MNVDLPTISDASHAHTVYGLGNLGQPTSNFVGTTMSGGWSEPATPVLRNQAQFLAAPHLQTVAAGLNVQKSTAKPKEPKVTRRLVQVFIADPNENLPLEDALLYSGEQKLTDLTDQELFFEIDIKAILAKHNEVRAKTIDKKVKERTEYLEPAKIRNLNMVVVTVASF